MKNILRALIQSPMILGSFIQYDCQTSNLVFYEKMKIVDHSTTVAEFKVLFLSLKYMLGAVYYSLNKNSVYNIKRVIAYNSRLAGQSYSLH